MQSFSSRSWQKAGCQEPLNVVDNCHLQQSSWTLSLLRKRISAQGFRLVAILYHPFYWEPRVLTLGSVSFTSVAELTHNFASLHINDISVILCPQAVSVSHRPCYGQTMVDNAVPTSRVIIDSVHNVISFLQLVGQLAQPDLLACSDRPATPTCCQPLDVILDPLRTMTFVHIGENGLQFFMVRLHRVLSVGCLSDLLSEIVLVMQELVEGGLAIRVREINIAHGSVNAADGVLHRLFTHFSSVDTIHDKPPYVVKKIDWWIGEEAYASSPYNRSYSLPKKSSNICSKVSPHSSASSCKSVSFWQAASYATHGLPVSISMLQSVCSKSYSAEFMAHVRLSHCGIFFAAQQWYSSRTCPQSNLLPCIWYCLTYFTISSACSTNSILIAFCLSCSLVLIGYTIVLPILYILLTVSSQLSVLLSAVGDGLPYGLHRTFHVLPLRPLCGADARLTFNFQGSRCPVYSLCPVVPTFKRARRGSVSVLLTF